MSWAAGQATNAGCDADAPEAAEDPAPASDALLDPLGALAELVVELIEDEWLGAGACVWLVEDDVVDAAFSALLLPDSAMMVITTSATAATAPANMIRRRQ